MGIPAFCGLKKKIQEDFLVFFKLTWTPTAPSEKSTVVPSEIMIYFQILPFLSMIVFSEISLLRKGQQSRTFPDRNVEIFTFRRSILAE